MVAYYSQAFYAPVLISPYMIRDETFGLLSVNLTPLTSTKEST